MTRDSGFSFQASPEKRALEAEQVPASLQRLIAAQEEPFAVELHHETFGYQGEIDHTVAMAMKAFEDAETKESVLETGESIEVTTQYMEIIAGDASHYCRLGRRPSGGKRLRRNKEESDIWLIIDQTKETDKIVSDNPWAFKVESGDDGMRGIYIEGRSLNELPSFNEEADLTFLRRVARTINEAEQTSQRQVEEDRALSRQWRLGTVKNVGGLLMSGLVFVAGVGGAVYATVEASNNLTAPEVFDEKDIQLSGGTPIPIGSTGTPEYSFELLTHPELSGDKIPQVGDHGDSNSDETTQGHGLTIDDGHDRDSAIHLSEDGLRTFNMHVGHEGEKNCETVYVRFDTPNDIVRAWTIEEDRVNEFSVEVESDSITACWEGQEESADDDPDIVIKVETPEPGSR